MMAGTDLSELPEKLRLRLRQSVLNIIDDCGRAGLITVTEEHAA